MTINATTKIAALLKHNPAALEAIVSISSKFEKLRNPLLRKLMAGRTSIAMASKIGRCSIHDFFAKLQPLGFEADGEQVITEIEENIQPPGFLQHAGPEQMVELDVRPVIEAGKDPLTIILEKIKTLQAGQVLKLINSFEPTPLMLLLEKQGFESYAESIHDDLVLTYFYKKEEASFAPVTDKPGAADDWDNKLQTFSTKLQTIDVRELEMPLPMLTILEALDNLPAGKALFVYHKRIPVFLLPELAERKFSYRIKEISDAEVHLLIYKD